MAPHMWSHLGDTVSDNKYHMYYHGQRIKEAYYRGEKIWAVDDFLDILLDKVPDKLHYSPEEEIDYSGARILGVWSSGRAEDITGECDFFPEEGTSIDLSKILLGIVLGRLPNKTAYSAGERINYDGLVILAVYADWHTQDITSECDFYLSPESIAAAPSLIGILVTKLPDKTIYARDEPLDFSGIRICAAYSNGRLADVTNECAIEKVESA